MKEQLIGFGTAQLAKEKGFNVECKKVWQNNYTNAPSRKWKIEDTSSIGFINERYFAPTQSLLQKWLREEKKTIVEVSPFDDWDNWVYKILQEDIMSPFFELEVDGVSAPTYEDSLEYGLIEALKQLG